ncbi:fungal-specific transcription factor domain-containing protein [Xylariaceae sp. FL0016]|nr:fungal-specific transcription factor domain-containing protein [Xylariaceae sp. FL0016]
MSQRGSCNVCASIKQKCDGSLPCSRCHRLGISCGYDRASGRVTTAASDKQRAVTIRRARTGCLTCKKRKKKCDGLRPKCADCRRLNLNCVYQGDLSPGSSVSSSSSQHTNAIIPSSPRPQHGDFVIEDTIDANQQNETGPYEWLNSASVPTAEDHWYEADLVTPTASPSHDKIEAVSIHGLGSIAPSRPEFSGYSSYTKTPPGLLGLHIPTMLPLSAREDRYLYHHYVTIVARSLCVSSRQEDNPYLRLLLPLASASSAVMGAVLALSACHLQHNGGYSEYVRTGLGHQTRAIAALNKLIDEGSTPNSPSDPFDTCLLALAAVLLFCIIDIRQSDSTNWFWHITAAKNLIASRRTSATGIGAASDPWPFLLDLSEYVDSIISLSKCQPPLIDHLEQASGSKDDSRADPLNPIFGLAKPLLRFIGQISALSNRRKYRVNARFEEKFRLSAATIGQNLRAWEPEHRVAPSIQSVQDVDLAAAIHCAYAIKFASILRLHQVVEGYKIPNDTSTECLRTILSHVQQIPIGSPAENSLVFPLFMAGAVSIEPEDRMTVSYRWAVIGRMIGFGNVAKGKIVLDMVWKTMDEELQRARESGGEETTEANWASIRWHNVSELVLF